MPDDLLAQWRNDPDRVGPTGTQVLIRDLAVEVDRLRAERDNDRIIHPDADRCPECGGWGQRGCGAAWHDAQPDTHCSPACQCRDEMRSDIRQLRTVNAQLQAQRDDLVNMSRRADAEVDRLRAQVADPGPSQAVESLSEDVTAGTEPEAQPLSSCPHIVTDDEGTSWCSLAEGQVQELARLREENAELNELFDLQHKRTTEAVAAWRAADPDNRKGILPDLGALLEWLLDQARLAVVERNEVAEAAACAFHTGPDAADDEIRRDLIRQWVDAGREAAEGWREQYHAAAMKVARAVTRRDELIETVRDLADNIDGRPLLKSETYLAAHTLRAGCDRAEGKG